MAALRHISRKLFYNFKPESKLKSETCAICIRLLNYSAIEYDEKHDPAPVFFNKDIQSLLKTLTRVDLAKVNRRRKLGTKKLEDPEYKFMTDEQLHQAIEKAKKNTEELLQIPPVVALRKPTSRVLSKDPALQGLEKSRMVFTDITFGVKDIERLIVVREPDGTLQEVDWEMRNRINQTYFPSTDRYIKPPKMFFGEYFESLLNRKEYEFVLDRACTQFEPNDPTYQRVVSITYQHVNDNDGFEILRSTRHFGALTFFLVWHKSIDNLMSELIETAHIEEADKLLELFTKVHGISFEGSQELDRIEDYIKKVSSKKAVLELGVQAYKDLAKRREELDTGIETAHGLR
ncbi:unnamed protein product [Phaedon cochleariae]|uniref:28S ribosomal protein S22, mitochondrial n=1 Tax=Phaedon cochleariae TaxID=80249 RepID=A0A9P0GKN1_PHACE|nr:unnamed protein product [Phaedon cochleariae]